MRTILAVTLALMFIPSVKAEDIASIPIYVEMKVISCTSALPLIEQKIKNAGYTNEELEHTRLSARGLGLLTAQPLQEVEYIQSFYDHSSDVYKGRVKNLGKVAVRQFMSPGMDMDFCTRFYLGKTQLFETTEHLSCGEIKDWSKHVTVAQCLTDLPTAHGLNTTIRELKKFPAR